MLSLKNRIKKELFMLSLKNRIKKEDMRINFPKWILNQPSAFKLIVVWEIFFWQSYFIFGNEITTIKLSNLLSPGITA
jgi:hypothetical protein